MIKEYDAMEQVWLRTRLSSLLLTTFMGVAVVYPAGTQASEMTMSDRQSLETLLSEDKRNIDAWIQLANWDLKKGDIEAATESVREGLKRVRKPAEELQLHGLAIQIENTRGNLESAKKHWRVARGLRGYEDSSEVHLAYAGTLIRQGEFAEAEELVKSLRVTTPSTTAFLLVLPQIKQAYGFTQNLAIYENTISRGKFADLLVTEFKLLGDTSKASIAAVSDAGLRGLRPLSGDFRADQSLTREEVALVVEDLLGSSKTQFIGTPSSFSDLMGTDTSFNAMMTALTRGYLAGFDDGTARPKAALSGAEAVIILGKLAEQKP